MFGWLDCQCIVWMMPLSVMGLLEVEMWLTIEYVRLWNALYQPPSDRLRK